MPSTTIWVRGTQQIDALLRVWARRWKHDPGSAISMHASDAIAGKSKGEECIYPVHEKLLAQLRKHVDVVEIIEEAEKEKKGKPKSS